MRTALKKLGRSAHCVGAGQKEPNRSEGEPWSVVHLGPAVGLAFCLAAGLMWSPPARAQQVYGLEFDQSDNLFGTINLVTDSFTVLGDEGSTLFNDIAATPDGTLYAIVNSSSLVTVSTANGAILSSVSFSVGGIESIAISPNGILYGATQSALYTINPGTGVATLVGNFNNSLLNGVGQNIRFAANGNLYDTDGGASALNTDLFQISLANGMATQVGVIDNLPGLCLENSGNVLYGVGIPLGSASTVDQDLIGLDLSSIPSGGSGDSSAPISYTKVTANFPENYNFSSANDFYVPGMPLELAPEPSVLGSFLAGAAVLLVINCRPRK